ncbi:MAG: S8 family serine peptidase, partial [Calditrichota bacterium]
MKNWPGVAAVEPDLPIEFFQEPAEREVISLDDEGTEPGLKNIRAPEVWDLGITGAGVLVSHLDGGVNGSHPALFGRWRGSYGYPASACWLDLLGTTTVPTDNSGHGTHTMGIILGMVPGDTIGVAWGARYISVRLNMTSGVSLISSALTGFQWLLDPDGNPATFDDVPRLVSNSWGLEAAAYPPCYSVFDIAINNCEAAGIAAFFAAGNEGSSGETIRIPAARAESIVNGFAVGAYDRIADSIWASSSRGPTPCSSDPQLEIKPEVVAPGRSVRSAWTGTAYQTLSGTSFSVAHAAGTAALMLEANPELTADSLKKILLLTAVDKGVPGEDNTYGTGRIDAYTAVLGALGGIGWIEGYVSDAFGYGVESEITFDDHPHHIHTDLAGHFVIAMPAQMPLQMHVNASTFIPHSTILLLTPGDTLDYSVTLQLEPNAGILTGTVINCFGSGADSARVWLPSAGVPEVLTNSQGW